MTDRELTALMAAMMVAGAYAGQCTFTIPDVVSDAEKILAEIDARETKRREAQLPECPPEPR